MKKTLFTLALLAMIMVSCTQDNLEIETDANRTITVSATMPKTDDDIPKTDDVYAQTRVSLTPDAETGNYGLDLKWETGDKLMLCFEYKSTYYHEDAPIVASSISSSGKTAQFTITIPNEIPANATFNLYGVYQKEDTWSDTNGGYFKEGTKLYVLEKREQQGVTFDKIGSTQSGIARPMLYFSQADIVNSSKPAFAPFNLQHSGWMMALHFKNSTEEEIDLPLYINLNKAIGSNEWVWNGQPGFNTIYFDIATQAFSYDETTQEKDETLKFSINEHKDLPLSGQKLAAGKSIVFYRWVASQSEVPQLRGEAYIGGNKHTSTNIPAKTVTNGKMYHVYTEWDGTNYKFVSAY